MAIRQAYQTLFLLNLLINAMIFTVSGMYIQGNEFVMGNSNVLSTELACNLHGLINTFCCCMEAYTLMCIALERYFSIVKQTPLTFNQVIGLLVFGWVEVGLVTR